MNRRRSERIATRLPFEVYCRGRRLGRFWTRNASRAGIFLGTGSYEYPAAAILELRFQVNGMEYCLRGTVAQHVQGQGIGMQRAYWRKGDLQAYSAYLQYALPDQLYRAALPLRARTCRPQRSTRLFSFRDSDSRCCAGGAARLISRSREAADRDECWYLSVPSD
jgi:hypothetical protein